MSETGRRSWRDNDNDDNYQKKRANSSLRRDNDNDDRYEKRRASTSSRRDNDNCDVRYHRREVNTSSRRDNDSDDDRYHRKRVNTSSRRDNDNDDDRYRRRRVSTSVGGNRDDVVNSGDGELVVYRILCPDRHMGIVIGKNGTVINSLRQATQSKIKVVDALPGATERILLIYCYAKYRDDREVNEDDMRPLCPAQEALMKVQEIIYTLSAAEEDDKKRKDEARILVPSSQVANIIGKSGSTINNLRNKTKAHIKITPKDPNDPTHSLAMRFDNFVQVKTLGTSFFFNIGLLRM